MQVSNLMHPPVLASKNDSISIAAELMRDHGIGCLVVASGLRPEGIVTDRDLVVRCLAAGHEPQRCTVGTHMTLVLFTAQSETDALEALHLMRSQRVKRLPVVAREEVVGVVSLSDIAAALETPMQELLSGMGAARREEPAKLIVR